MADVVRNLESALEYQVSFEESASTIPVFDPDDSTNDNLIEYLFEHYDIKQQDFIERNTVKRMVMTILAESGLPISDDVSNRLSEDIIKNISDKTLEEENIKHDGIRKKEWRRLMVKYPTIFKVAISKYPGHLVTSIIALEITSHITLLSPSTLALNLNS
ncbi:hypothetical protein L1887_27971 [Cichorium endivia]|nr:hypothetical protein L1887_27971 [Cichorium endivia]